MKRANWPCSEKTDRTKYPLMVHVGCRINRLGETEREENMVHSNGQQGFVGEQMKLIQELEELLSSTKDPEARCEIEERIKQIRKDLRNVGLMNF